MNSPQHAAQDQMVLPAAKRMFQTLGNWYSSWPPTAAFNGELHRESPLAKTMGSRGIKQSFHLHLHKIMSKPSPFCRIFKLEMRTGDCHRGKTSQGTYSPAAHRSPCAFYLTCKRAGNSSWGMPAKIQNSTSARSFPKILKSFQSSENFQDSHSHLNSSIMM